MEWIIRLECRAEHHVLHERDIARFERRTDFVRPEEVGLSLLDAKALLRNLQCNIVRGQAGCDCERGRDSMKLAPPTSKLAQADNSSCEFRSLVAVELERPWGRAVTKRVAPRRLVRSETSCATAGIASRAGCPARCTGLATRGVRRRRTDDIGWRLPIRWLMTLLMLDSAGALEILSPFRRAAL